MRVALLLMLLSGASWAGEAFGVWKLNPARSTLAGNQKSVTLRIERHTRGEVFTLDTVAADGRASTSSTILYFDGKTRDFQDSACSGTQSSRRVDGQTVEILRQCGNGGWTRFVRRLAAQPKELVLEITEQHSDGRGFERHLVLEKQSSSGIAQKSSENTTGQNDVSNDQKRCNMKGKSMEPNRHKVTGLAFVLALTLLAHPAEGGQESSGSAVNPVLEWNQIFIDTLIATNTANSSSQRLGAIVHTAIFDAYNGIEQRYTPLFVRDGAPRGASRRAAIIAAGYTALVGLFPSQKPALDARYAASLAALRLNCQDQSPERRSSCTNRIDRGIDWGSGAADAVLGWRANDGFSVSYTAFNGGTAVGQWRPTPPALGAMSAQGLAFTDLFVLVSNTQFRPGPPRSLTSPRYTDDFNAVKALGRATGSTRTEDQTALAVFWEGNASVHWNQAANQIAQANHLSLSASNRLLAVLNIAMADTAFTIWSGKRLYGSMPIDVTWRPVTSIPMADTDTNMDTTADPAWLPLITTPSHPEYPAGHPSLNGAAATVLVSHFRPQQAFTLTTPGQPARTYRDIRQARSDGNNARVWGGMHYPSTVQISDAVGQAIANYVNQNSMQRLRRSHPDLQ